MQMIEMQDQITVEVHNTQWCLQKRSHEMLILRRKIRISSSEHTKEVLYTNPVEHLL